VQENSQVALTVLSSGRPFRIGKHRASQQEFDDEVLRLFKLGRKLEEIAGILKRERTAIWRSLKRSRARDPAQLQAARAERQYRIESKDEFLMEPTIHQFVEDMRARRISRHAMQQTVAQLREMCEELQIYPDQLDLQWGKKWLATKGEVPLDKLRPRKLSARAFFKAQGVSDYELTLAGFDAKHYGVGKWKHVKLTEEQICKVRTELAEKATLEAQFVFSFGVETCRTLEPIWSLTGDRFYTLRADCDGRQRTLYCANVFRKKTEKAGAAYKTAYVSRGTFELATRLVKKNGNKFLAGKNPRRIYRELRTAYKKAEVTVEYFYQHPIHALRHSGAQRLLEKTGFNRAVVAELGGWEAEKTLEDHYGGVPLDIIRGVAGSLLTDPDGAP
jgi:integrase